jgi:predicted permease
MQVLALVRILTRCFQQLNRLNVSLLTPALLFSKVALYLTPGIPDLGLA